MSTFMRTSSNEIAARHIRDLVTTTHSSLFRSTSNQVGWRNLNLRSISRPNLHAHLANNQNQILIRTSNQVGWRALRDMVRQGRFVDNASDLATELAITPSFQQVFNTWTRFATPDRNSGEQNAWIFVPELNVIRSTVNSVNYVGFMSTERTENYRHEVTVSAPTDTTGDDDPIGIIICAHEENGVLHTLSALRFPNEHQRSLWGNNLRAGANPAADIQWSIVYNYHGVNPAIIANGDHLLTRRFPTATRWRGRQQNNDLHITRSARIIIERNGDHITAVTSQMSDSDPTLPVDNNTRLTVNLANDPRLHRFRGPQSYGYAQESQPQASFTNVVFSDISASIIDISTNIVRNFVNGQWVVDSSRTAESLIGTMGTFIHNPRTNRFYFYYNRNNFGIIT